MVLLVLKTQETNVKPESKRKSPDECKQFMVDVLFKINGKLLMQFSIVQNARSLDPLLMTRFPKVPSQRFTKLADRLFALNKISANTADKSKNQYADLLNMVRFEHKEKFLDFKMK